MRSSLCIALALLFLGAALQVSYANKVTISGDKDTVDVEAAFNKENNDTIDITVGSTKAELLMVPLLKHEVEIRNETWLESNASETNTIYNLDYMVMLAHKSADVHSPCEFVLEAHVALCALKLKINTEESYVFYLRIDHSVEGAPTIKIVSSAFDGSFKVKDSISTATTLENQSVTIYPSKDFNETSRFLQISKSTEEAEKIMKQLKPALIHFDCEKLHKLSVFEADSLPIGKNVTINLEQLGLAFYYNYSCTFTLIVSDASNSSLVPLNSGNDIHIVTYPEEPEEPEPQPDDKNLTLEETVKKLVAGQLQMKESMTEMDAGLKKLKEALSTMSEKAKEMEKQSIEGKTVINQTFQQIQAAMKNMSEGVLKLKEGLLNMSEKAKEMEKQGKEGKVTITETFELKRTLIIILFVLVALLIIAVSVQCFVLLKLKNNATATWQSSGVEITSNSNYLKA